MSKSNYILINQQFAVANRNHSSGNKYFSYGVTKSGEYVTAAQTLNDFPELFAGELSFPGIIITSLDTTDFPQTQFPP